MTDKEFMVHKIKECNELRKENKTLKEENRWLKKVLELALGDRVIVVREEEINSMAEPMFDLAENLENELLVRNLKKGANNG